MNNFISSNVWIWGDTTPMQIVVSRLATSYYMKFTIGHSSVDFTLEKESLQELQDKINEALLMGAQNE